MIMVISCAPEFQSTPSVGRATITVIPIFIRHRISIHALRGEGDHESFYQHRHIAISIHALRGEGDMEKFIQYMRLETFQSTPSVGRATFRRA